MSALLLLFFTSIALANNPVTIIEINPDSHTRIVKSELEKALVKYDLLAYIFTKLVNVESGVISHSHPVLTINTKYFNHPYLILSVFLHEQFHHYLSSEHEKVAKFLEWTELRYPTVPVYPNGGARSEFSTRLHLLVCFLEVKILSSLIGEELARSEIESFSHYQWIYQQVFADEAELDQIIRKLGLMLGENIRRKIEL